MSYIENQFFSILKSSRKKALKALSHAHQAKECEFELATKGAKRI
jgi:hypothetical protein